MRNRSLGDRTLQPPELLAGGGGLVSTAGDYHRRFDVVLMNPPFGAGSCRSIEAFR